MDPGLLQRYNEELAHLREVGAEFAAEFPKIASRLTLEGLEVADPYVERLLEGFAFMAARVQLKLDAEYPRFLAHLFETVMPDALAPVPSMMVARLDVELDNPSLQRGAALPRGTAITSAHARGQGTRCEFRTAHALQLWPLSIEDVRYASHFADVPPTAWPQPKRVRSALRLRLRVHGGQTFATLPLDTLPLYLAAPSGVALRLHELIAASSLGSSVVGAAHGWRDARCVACTGFADDEALLPDTHRSFSGHRLLQELAAMPQRFLFVELRDLRARLQGLNTDTVDILLPFERHDAGLEPLVDRAALALHAVPAINLFPKRLDRIHIGAPTTPPTAKLGTQPTTPLTTPPTAHHGTHHHVVPDRTRPLDFEVHSITSVTGHGTGEIGKRTYTPLYATTFDTAADAADHSAHYTVQRDPRLLSQRQRQHGARSSYVGTETYVCLVDAREQALRDDVRQLAITALVTNRDLPVLLPTGAAAQAASPASLSSGATSFAGDAAPSDWTIDTGSHVKRVHALCGPTRPTTREPTGRHGWDLVAQINLDVLSIAADDPSRAAGALRALLQLQGPRDDAAWGKLVDGIVAVRARPVTRRLPDPDPRGSPLAFDRGAGPSDKPEGTCRLAFGSGMAVEIDIDELNVQGSSAVLLGSVIERMLARRAALNTFTQTTLRSTTRGVLVAWPPRIGCEPML